MYRRSGRLLLDVGDVHSGSVIPVMGILYVLISLIVIIANITNVPAMFGMIFKD
ncbi:MAG: alanine:cation symporter family protein, partial [Ruminococcus sp.]|nr:alanine:cation symporter family protein [Ruminococcus sp.]